MSRKKWPKNVEHDNANDTSVCRSNNWAYGCRCIPDVCVCVCVCLGPEEQRTLSNLIIQYSNHSAMHTISILLHSINDVIKIDIHFRRVSMSVHKPQHLRTIAWWMQSGCSHYCISFLKISVHFTPPHSHVRRSQSISLNLRRQTWKCTFAVQA